MISARTSCENTTTKRPTQDKLGDSNGERPPGAQPRPTSAACMTNKARAPDTPAAKVNRTVPRPLLTERHIERRVRDSGAATFNKRARADPAVGVAPVTAADRSLSKSRVLGPSIS